MNTITTTETTVTTTSINPEGSNPGEIVETVKETVVVTATTTANNGNRRVQDESLNQLGEPKKKLHTEAADNAFNELDPTLDQGKASKAKDETGRRSRRKGEGEESDSEYEGEEEGEDYLEDDGMFFILRIYCNNE